MPSCAKCGAFEAEAGSDVCPRCRRVRWRDIVAAVAGVTLLVGLPSWPLGARPPRPGRPPIASAGRAPVRPAVGATGTAWSGPPGRRATVAHGRSPGRSS